MSIKSFNFAKRSNAKCSEQILRTLIVNVVVKPNPELCDDTTVSTLAEDSVTAVLKPA